MEQSCCQLDTDDNRIAAYCKALGHPARIRIIKTLLLEKSCCCGDIVGCLPLAQATVSQHLKVLQQSGLIAFKQQGLQRCYYLNPSHFLTLKQFFNHIEACLP